MDLSTLMKEYKILRSSFEIQRTIYTLIYTILTNNHCQLIYVVNCILKNNHVRYILIDKKELQDLQDFSIEPSQGIKFYLRDTILVYNQGRLQSI